MNRIDDVITFNELSISAIEPIVDLQSPLLLLGDGILAEVAVAQSIQILQGLLRVGPGGFPISQWLGTAYFAAETLSKVPSARPAAAMNESETASMLSLWYTSASSMIFAIRNDQIYNFVSDYMDGAITREQFWALAKFKYPTHQICFCSDSALDCLNFVHCEEV